MSLLSRLYLLVALAAAPAFGLVLFNDWQLRQAAEERVEADALRYARLVSGELDRTFSAVRNTLGATAKSPSVQAFREDECARYLSSVGEDHPNLSRLGVIRADGQGACGLEVRVDPATSPSLRAALGTKDGYLGEYTVGRGSSTPILPFAQRIEDADGAPVGVIASGLRLDWLGDTFAAKAGDFPPGTSITIVDRNGTILVRLPNRERAGASLSGYPQLRAEHGGVLRSKAADTSDGVARIVGFTAIPELPVGVGVAVGLSEEVVLAPIREATRRNLLLVALTAVLAMAAARIGGRAFIKRPVDALLATAERLRAGDFTARTSLAGKGSELARLGSAFNAMASELASRDQEREAAAQALRDSEERLLIAQDAARIGVWDWDLCDNRIAWSRQMYELLGIDPENDAADLYGAWLGVLHPEDRERTDRLVRRHAQALGPFVGEFRIVRTDGRIRWILVRGQTLPDEGGRPRRTVGANLDITEIREQEVRETFLLSLADHLRDIGSPGELLETAARLLGRQLDASCVGYSEVNEGEGWATVLAAWRPEGIPPEHRADPQGPHSEKRTRFPARNDARVRDGSIASIPEAGSSFGPDAPGRGRFRADAFGAAFAALKAGRSFVVHDARTDPRTMPALDAYESVGAIASVTVPLVQDGRLRGFLFAHQAMPRMWTAGEQELCREVAERTWGALERVRGDARRRLLINELNHRVKNTLATVQSIAAQAFRGSEQQAGARQTFEARLFALSKAHDVLTRENWDGADMVEIVADAVAPFGSSSRARFRVEGPPVRLPANLALSLAMTLHELSTNAVKYGGLSVPDGLVDIRWAVDRAEASARLKLTWRESGGPAVSAPLRKGFGSRLIERSLSHEHGGEVRISYPASGLVCEIALSLAGEETPSGPAAAPAPAGAQGLTGRTGLAS